MVDPLLRLTFGKRSAASPTITCSFGFVQFMYLLVLINNGKTSCILIKTLQAIDVIAVFHMHNAIWSIDIHVWENRLVLLSTKKAPEALYAIIAINPSGAKQRKGFPEKFTDYNLLIPNFHFYKHQIQVVHF